jgi:transposase, IS5 family
LITHAARPATNNRAPGGQFVLHARTLPGNPYDGHTLGAVIEDTERLTGCEIERAYVDKGYRGHRAANPRRVFISGQKRGVFGVIKRELRRRCAIEAVIGHMKTDGHLAAAISRAAKAMPPTSSSPPSATTCDSSWPSSGLSVA